MQNMFYWEIITSSDFWFEKAHCLMGLLPYSMKLNKEAVAEMSEKPFRIHLQIAWIRIDFLWKKKHQITISRLTD